MDIGHHHAAFTYRWFGLPCPGSKTDCPISTNALKPSGSAVQPCITTEQLCDLSTVTGQVRYPVAFPNSINWLVFLIDRKDRKCTLGVLTILRKATISFVMSARMKQLGSHRTDFHKIWYEYIFKKSVEKNQFSLKSDNNNRYFTWRPMYIYDNISLSSSQNEKCFRQKL
jgi:hypothetical protein